MNTRKIPHKEKLLEAIHKYNGVMVCINVFNCDYRTFHKWLRHYHIVHNFHKGKNGYWKNKSIPEETRRKISITKKNAPKKLKLKRVIQPCCICGRNYINVPDSKHRSLNKKYCSNECSREGMRRFYKNKPKHLVNYTCTHCGCSFQNYPSANYNKFCSADCFKEHNFNLRNGKSYDDIYGVEKSNSIKSKIAIATAIKNQNVNPFSKPHAVLKDSMIKEGIYGGFESCQPLYYFEIDELNKSKKICVEVDGDYWHSLPKRIIQDKRKDTFLTNKGYTVIRIKEQEIYDNVNTCIDKIKSGMDVSCSQSLFGQ